MKPNRPMGLLLMLLLLTSLSLATTQVGSIGLRRRRQQQRQQQQQQQTSFPCRPGQVTTISGSSVGAGIIETPDFPDAFPLPLFCAWIIDNAGNSKQPFVNIYFTQFYLAPGYLMVEGHNSYAAALNWTLSVLPSDDGRQRQNWQERPKAGTKEGFLALKLVLNNSASYNRLHMRALEMYNSFGFRIAFEVSSAPYNDRADACSLVDCSLTGECLVKIDQTKKKIANFSCACVAPNRAEKIERKFSGSKCGGHEILEECLTTGGRIKCSNHGQCRYLSSRHVSCKCDEGFAGTFCERRKEDEKGKGEDLSSDAASLQHCPNEFVLLNVLRDLQRVITFLMSNFIKTKVDDGVELYGEPNKPDSGRLFFHAKNETALQQLHSKLAKFIASYPNIFRGKIGGNPDVHGGLCAKGMIVTPDLPLRPQVQFHLSCSVTVPMIDNINVKFQWFKDDTINNRQFSINTTLAKRYMATDNKKGDEKTLIGLLTVKEANKVDNGKFKCLAVSEELSRLVRVDLKDDSLNQSPPLPPPFRTSASATLVVVVEQRPDIEVFPRTITIIKDNKIKNQNRTLHCVAGKNQIFSGDASNYLFRWFRSTSPASPSEAFSTKEVAIGETEGGHSGPEFVEDVWMPSGDEVVIYGLLLRLDDIQEDANYTCEVTDRRSGHDSTTTASLTSRVTVRVYVADSELDVCPAEIEAGFVWPQTKKSTVAIRVCPEDERGFVYHKCQPTNEHFQRAVWEKKLNSADCIQKRISVEEENLHRVMNGYFINSDSDTFPLIYFENLPAGSRGRPLDSSEWTVVTDMSNQVLDYLKTKSVLPKMPNLPRSFFVHFVSWLLESGIDVIQPISTFRHSDKRYLDLFKLVYKAAKLFSSKLEIGMEDLQSYPENENPCQTLLSVKMARLKSPLKGIPMGTHNASNDITCAGMTKVEISSTTEAQTLETSLSLTVIHFRKIDRVLSAAYATPNASYIRSFNSSIVTVSVESPDLLHPKQNSLAVTISIQFLDFRFAENDTGWTNLSCGRLEIGSVEPRWSFKDPFCGLSWHPDGLICNCSRQGSVALVWTEEVVMGWVLC